LLLIQRELPSRDREGAVLTGEEFPKMVKHPKGFANVFQASPFSLDCFLKPSLQRGSGIRKSRRFSE
jgi:hypothetical protein